MPFIARPAAGQIIDPAWGTLVADAVVMRFTTAAQRSSQLTAPAANQLTMRDDRAGVIERWTGTAWVDLSAPRELAHAEKTTATPVASGTEAGADLVVAAPAVTFDGATAVLIELFAPAVVPATGVANSLVMVWLYLDGVSIGRMGSVGNPVVGQMIAPFHAVRRMTPAAGSRQFSFAATQTGGNGTVFGGTGGLGQYMPAFIRITRAA